jgi:DNA-binding NarL/FixJ family response regulator
MLDPELFVVVGEAGFLPDGVAALRGADVIVAAGEENLGAAPAGGYPSLAFVILTDDGDRTLSWLRAASPFGWGILPPDATPEEIGAAAISAANGLAVLPRDFAEEMADSMAEGLGGEAPPEPLTAREREVLALLAEGLSNRKIARELYISEHTVKFHLSSIFAKLDVSSRAGAVSRGAHFGLVSL